MKGPILKGTRIVLRPIKVGDAQFFVDSHKDKEVFKYLLFQPVNLKLVDEVKWVKNTLKAKDKITWVLLNENKQLIGNTELRLNAKDKLASFGILIADKKQWGRGYAPECLEILKKYLFKKLKYNRLELDVYVNNKRAVRAYEKAGFKLEGVKRKCHYNQITKRYEDQAIMSILKEEYLKNNK